MKFTYRFNLLLPDQFRIPMVILLIVLADILFYRSETSSIGSVPFLIFYLLLLIFSLPHHLDFMPLNFRLPLGICLFPLRTRAALFGEFLQHCASAVCAVFLPDGFPRHGVGDPGGKMAEGSSASR